MRVILRISEICASHLRRVSRGAHRRKWLRWRALRDWPTVAERRKCSGCLLRRADAIRHEARFIL